MLKTKRHGRVVLFLTACFLLILAASAGEPVLAQNWDVKIVPTTNPPTGGGPSLAFDPADGNPSIAYIGSSSMVRFTHWNSTAWVSENVVTGAAPTLIFNSAGQPTILCAVPAPGGKYNLSLFTKSGSVWSSQAIDTGVGSNRSGFAYDSAGNPSAMYLKVQKGNTPARLMFATRNGSTWVKETVETDATSGGDAPALAYDPSGNPSAAYSINVASSGNDWRLKFNRKTGSSWAGQLIESAPVSFLDLAYDGSGNPVIVFYNNNSALRQASWNGSAWAIETIYSAQVIRGISLVFDDLGMPIVGFVDNSGILNQSNAVVMWKTVSGWVSETIMTGTLNYASLALDSYQLPVMAIHQGSPSPSFPQELFLATRWTGPLP